MSPIESWLPLGYVLENEAKVGKPLHTGKEWQIIELSGGGKAVLVIDDLLKKWMDCGLLSPAQVLKVSFGDASYGAIDGGNGGEYVQPISKIVSFQNKSEIISFAFSLKETRERAKNISLGDGIYIEKISRILPTYTEDDDRTDELILGAWITGGKPVAATSSSALYKHAGWLSKEHIDEILKTSGITSDESNIAFEEESDIQSKTQRINTSGTIKNSDFSLPGRSEIEHFFNEHIFDIIKNQERYKALGIDFPSAVILYGPPGCGKTFAVEKLIDYLNWPSYTIEASSVASPYIHDTSKKIAEVFDKAMENAPSVLVIDEMEAFLTDRDSSSHQHHIEEVGEFLRRIPLAIKNEVLIIAMTNKIELIDPAILRKGRFDHHIKVDFAKKEEVKAMIEHLLSSLPHDDIDTESFAEELAGRPLSDVAYMIKEGARLTAKAGKDKIDQDAMEDALNAISKHDSDQEEKRNRMGFIRD